MALYNRYLWFEIKRNFVTTRCVLWDLLRPKSDCGRGSAPDPAEGAYSAPQTPIAGGEGARASALRASSLAPQTQKPNFAHRRWEICRTNQNTAATALFGVAYERYTLSAFRQEKLTDIITSLAYTLQTSMNVLWIRNCRQKCMG